MIDMPTIESIRGMSRQGLTNAEIRRRTGVSQPTIRKYLAMDDFSPQMPAKSRRGSILDPYKPFIDSVLEGDLHVWRKQRHSAQRIYERLLGETPHAGGYGIVKKHVRERRAQMKAPETAFVELVWAPGEAQAGSGDVDVVCRSERVRMHFFALGFPFSNMGFCQLFAGETSECVCQGLKDVFERVGGVPHRIVSDSATGAGRKIGGKVTEAELFSRVCALRVLGGLRRPGFRPREGQRRARGRLVAPAPVRADARAGRHRGVQRGAVGKMMLARIGGFGLGPAPDVGPDLSAYDGLLGCDAA